jgi:glycoprotein-N-acetylgalactosamine 3-beta-galactosyltransferase
MDKVNFCSHLKKAMLLVLIIVLVFSVYYFSKQENKFLNPIRKIIFDQNEISGSNKSLPTVFCLVKTHPKNIDNKVALNSYLVWVKKCDNYRFSTLIPKHLRDKNYTSSKTIEVFNDFFMIQPQGLVNEDHGNLTLKMYNSFVYVRDNLPSYDWYYIVDDDAYLNVKNLKEFLKDKDSNEAITFGYDFNFAVKDGFHGGGPGFALSNGAFKLITNKLKQNISNCPNSGTDDLDINLCLRNYGGKIGKSIDEKGRERFLGFSMMLHFKGEYTQWIKERSKNPSRGGLDCCSDQLIAAHQRKPINVFRLDLAMELANNISRAYPSHLGVNKPVTFKSIIKIYLLLNDIESDQNLYKNLINF